MLFPYLDCSADLDGDVCIVKCSGSLSPGSAPGPVIQINDTRLRNDDNCYKNSSDASRAYCKFQTNIGVKIMKRGTYVFECNSNGEGGNVICNFTITFGE